MKAIFAVSALAAAISAQAIAADTEATTTFSGAMDIRFVYDLEADPATNGGADTSYDVDLYEDDFDWGLKMDVNVVNGPFSGTVGIENDEGTTAVTLDDIIVTDGKLSFGQVGNLMDTDAYVDGTVSMSDDSADTAAVNLGDNIGFQYMVTDEATVELGGLNNDAPGSIFLAAKYSAEAGALAYVAEGEVQLSAAGAENDLDPAYFAGAGVTYTADVATVAAAVNAVGDTAGNTDMELGV